MADSWIDGFGGSAWRRGFDGGRAEAWPGALVCKRQILVKQTGQTLGMHGWVRSRVGERLVCWSTTGRAGGSNTGHAWLAALAGRHGFTHRVLTASKDSSTVSFDRRRIRRPCDCRLAGSLPRGFIHRSLHVFMDLFSDLSMDPPRTGSGPSLRRPRSSSTTPR